MLLCDGWNSKLSCHICRENLMVSSSRSLNLHPLEALIARYGATVLRSLKLNCVEVTDTTPGAKDVFSAKILPVRGVSSKPCLCNQSLVHGGDASISY